MADFTLVERIDTDLVRRVGARFADALPGFDVDRLVQAQTGWPDTLLPRLTHIADAIERQLPTHPRPVLAAVVDELPEGRQRELGFDVWPLIELLGRGLDDPGASLAILRDLGAKAYAEKGVRPYLLDDLHGTLAVLLPWTDDPRAGTRRLASESSRPRLPWAPVLRPLLDDPTPTLPILEALRDDGDHLTRNSVANHLNDITRTHPGLVVDLLADWLAQPSEGREWIADRALRSLSKAGHRGALAVLGRGPIEVTAVLRAAPSKARIGGEIRLDAEVRSNEEAPREARIEYAVHYQRASGGTTRKVFRWATTDLEPRGTWSATRAQHVRDLSTRTHQPGPHQVELLVNGVVVAEASFDLV